MKRSAAKHLIKELLANPTKFHEKGMGYELLQEYFNGFSLDTLHPLLGNNDIMIRREAVWIASELGNRSCSLIRHIIPLVNEEDRYVLYHALETIMVCSTEEGIDEFVHIVRSLQSGDDVIRLLAMRLMSNARTSQIKAAATLFTSAGYFDELHQKGLSVLLKGDPLGAELVKTMINDKEPLIRKYGAIAAKKLFQKFPKLMIDAASSTDGDIRNFAQEVVAMNKPSLLPRLKSE